MGVAWRISAAIAAATLAAAACSSSGGSAVVTSVTAAATTQNTAAAPSTTTESATTEPSTAQTSSVGPTTTSATVGAITQKAQGALLTPAEVGTGFATDQYAPSDPTQPGACGKPSADASIPPPVKVGTVILNDTTNQALLEEIRVYNDATDAATAYQTGGAGLSCSAGTTTRSDGSTTQLTISAPANVAGDVGGDQATAWQVQSSDSQGVLVAVRLQAAIVTFQFQAPAGPPVTVPNPLDVAKTGVTKVNNA